MDGMTDLFQDKAADWDQRPVPQQISEGVFAAIDRHVTLGPDLTVMDFGAGTGLVTARLAPRVGKILAVDVSPAMLEQLANPIVPPPLSLPTWDDCVDGLMALYKEIVPEAVLR